MKMTIKLNAPGMTSLHKAGLAGLYLTLRAFEEKGERIKGLDWELEPTQIVLQWSDKMLKDALQNLIERSFRLEDGLIVLTGLEMSKHLSTDQKYHLYESLLLSFLQYGRHRTKDQKKRPLLDQVDDQVKLIDKDFEPITLYRHQEVVTRKIFIDDEGLFRKLVNVPSWMYPGGIIRHDRHKEETALKEPFETALALLYAPVGVLYYRLKSRAKGRKALLAIVIPDIFDLETYAEFRHSMPVTEVLELYASSASDAAMRSLSSLSALKTIEGLASLSSAQIHCRVITFGIVNWSEQQKTRTYTHSVFSARIKGMRDYQLAAALFKNRWQTGQEQNLKIENKQQITARSYYVTVPTAREFIADNIAQGHDWYHDLANFICHREARMGLFDERKELYQMVEQGSMSESERIFVNVCHKSWSNRMARLLDRAGKGGGYQQSLLQKEFERLRTSLMRSRNAHSLRQTVVDLWGRAGLNEELQGGGLQKLWPLFNEQNWRKTRDLALLALISYQPKDKRVAAALSTEPQQEGDETNE